MVQNHFIQTYNFVFLTCEEYLFNVHVNALNCEVVVLVHTCN